MKKTLAFFMVLLLLVSFIACSAPGGKKEAGTGGSEGTKKVGGDNKLVAKENIKNLNFAWIYDNMSIRDNLSEAHRSGDNWFPYEQIVKGLEFAQEDYGLNIDTINSSDFINEENLDSSYDRVKKMVNACIEDGYDGIILSDVDFLWKSEELIDELYREGIPVVTLGGGTYADSSYSERIANIGISPAESGAFLAKLTNKVLEGQGQVATINPEIFSELERERFEYLIEELNTYPDIELIEIDYDEYAKVVGSETTEKFTEFYNKYPNLDALIKPGFQDVFAPIEYRLEKTYRLMDRNLKLIKFFSASPEEFEENNLNGNKVFGAANTNLIAAAYDAVSIMINYLTTGENPEDKGYTYLLVTPDNYKNINDQLLGQVKRKDRK